VPESLAALPLDFPLCGRYHKKLGMSLYYAIPNRLERPIFQISSLERTRRSTLPFDSRMQSHEWSTQEPLQ
jgi:hypothetical protein